MKKQLTGFLLALVIGCTAESLSPQARFTFETADKNAVNARLELYKLAIENNLFFEDHSHRYPSGNFTVVAQATRADGLELLLLGGGENNQGNISQVTIAVHCHKKCKNWKPIYDIALEKFGKKWNLTNE